MPDPIYMKGWKASSFSGPLKASSFSGPLNTSVFLSHSDTTGAVTTLVPLPKY